MPEPQVKNQFRSRELSQSCGVSQCRDCLDFVDHAEIKDVIIDTAGALYDHDSTKRTCGAADSAKEAVINSTKLIACITAVPMSTSNAAWLWGAGGSLPPLKIYRSSHQEASSPKIPNPHINRSNQIDFEQEQLPVRPRSWTTLKMKSNNRVGSHSADLRHSNPFIVQKLLPPISRCEEEGVVSRAAQPLEAPPPISDTCSTVASDSCILWGQVLSDAISQFEATEIILVAEIESDEQCVCILAQKSAANCDGRHGGTFPHLLQKQKELERKVRLNKEKLVLVRERLRTLRRQRTARRAGDVVETENPEQLTNSLALPEFTKVILEHDSNAVPRTALHRQTTEVKKRTKPKKKRNSIDELDSCRPTVVAQKTRDDEVAAAITIQTLYRMHHAQKLFTEMVKLAYQRIYDPESKKYFYYNRHTQQSQWTVPSILKKANDLHQQSSTIDQTVAATQIQALFRRRTARLALKRLLAQVYQEVFDPETKMSYYYCKHTNTSTWEKPKLLARHEREVQLSFSASSYSSKKAHPCQQEQAMHLAASKVQRLFRNRASRIFIRDLAMGSLTKHLDEDSGVWYYFNRRTQQTFWESTTHLQLRGLTASSTST